MGTWVWCGGTGEEEANGWACRDSLLVLGRSRTMARGIAHVVGCWFGVFGLGWKVRSG